MTDTFKEIAAFFDEHTDFSLLDGILLSATDFSVDEVRMWIADTYPNQMIPHAQMDGENGAMHFWMLDGRLTSPAEIVESLSSRGLNAKDRTEGLARRVYVLIPDAVRTARWN